MTTETVIMSHDAKKGNTGLVVRSASVTLAGLIYQLFISFFSGLVVARLIGPASFGVFSIARNLCESITVFTKAGFDIGIVRYLGEHSAPGKAGYNARFLRLMLTSVILLSIVPIAAIYIDGKGLLESYIRKSPDFVTIMMVMVLSIPLMSLTQVLGGVYRGFLRIRNRIIAEYFLQPSARLLIILILFLLGWRIWAAITGTVLSFAIAVVYLLILGKSTIFCRTQDEVRPVERRDLWRDLIEVGKYSIVISLTVSVATLLQRADVLMLGYFAPSDQVGQYAVIQMIVTLIVLPNSALNQAIAPLLARLYKEGDREEMRRLIHQHTRWVMICSMPIFLIMAFLGNQLVAIFGKGYVVETPPIALLALSQLVIAVLSSAGFMLSMTGRHMLEFYTMLVALICNIVLNYLLIPHYGIMGASIGTLSAVIVANILRSLQVYKVHGIFPIGREILMPILLGIGGFAGTFFIAQLVGIGKGIFQSMIVAVVFSVTYMFLVIKFGLVEDDKLLFGKVMRKFNLIPATEI